MSSGYTILSQSVRVLTESGHQKMKNVLVLLKDFVQRTRFYVIFFDNKGSVMQIQSQVTYIKMFLLARHPGATSLTWGILGDFSNVNTCKCGFPYCGPTLPLVAMTLYETWFCTTTGSFYVNLNYFVEVVFFKKILKIFPIETYARIVYPIVIPTDPLGIMIFTFLWLSPPLWGLNKLEFPLPKNDLHKVWLKLGCWFWRRRFFFNINTSPRGFLQPSS
jgi:hypothetical protein